MYEPVHNMEIFEENIMRESPTRCVKTRNYKNGTYLGGKDLNIFFNKKPNTINSEEKCYIELKNKLYIVEVLKKLDLEIVLHLV